MLITRNLKLSLRFQKIQPRFTIPTVPVAAMVKLMTQPERLCYSHTLDQHNPLAEKNTLRALVLTLVIMIIEIGGGWYFNSMSLLADCWHIGSHVLGLRLAVWPYRATCH